MFAALVWGARSSSYVTDGDIFGLSYVMGNDVERARYTVLSAESSAHAWAVPK